MPNYELRERAPSGLASDPDDELIVVWPKTVGRPKTVLVSVTDRRVIGVQG